MPLADRIEAHFQSAWLRRGLTATLLWPLSALHGVIVHIRRWAYEKRVLRSDRLPLPVLVIGNRIVGGAGKTPTTLAILAHLRETGWHPGVLTRGYGAQPRVRSPLLLDATTCQKLDARTTGDEPWLIWRRSGAPLMIGPHRARSGHALMRAHPEVDVLVCDDGLQHLALQRDIEVVVFDERGAGNGWMLPAGPLREPIRVTPSSPLVHPPLVLYNATAASTLLPGHTSQRKLGPLMPLSRWWLDQPPEAPHSPTDVPAQPIGQVHALAGIAHPERFFVALRGLGLSVCPLPLPDHAPFDSLPWPEDVTDLVVTEKDAVKLDPARLQRERPRTRVWVAVLDFQPEAGFWRELDAALARLPRRPAPN